MNLVIDQGNTSIKVAVFNNNEEVFFQRFPQAFPADALLALQSKFPILHTIVSSVGNPSLLPLTQLKALPGGVVWLSHDTPLPIANEYSSPLTLGVDRLASCVGANFLLPHKNILVVDFGTCITMDVLRADATFLGGNISPGMQMRFKALHNFTSALPLLSSPVSPPPLLGKNTQQALEAGVVGGITAEVSSLSQNLSLSFPDLQIFFTGGDCFFFERCLKSSIFVSPNLLLIGLNRIISFLNV